jgi:tripartite-type tricarboxylate transporter receptor subunit TctC
VLDRRSFIAAAAAAGVLPSAQAQTAWPNGVIRALCPFPPGSGADLKARWYSNKLAQKIGATVIVENKPGAMGYLATDLAAKAKPDGQTIYINPGASMLAAAPALFKVLRFDPVNDFEHIALLNYSSFALCVPSKSGLRTLAELTQALGRKGADGLYGSIAPPSVVFAETYKARFGLQTREVKYKEAGPLISDIINGTIDFVCIDLISVAGLVTDGRLKPLAMACEQRMKATPDIPGAAEVGITNFDLKGWWSVEVPARTPKDICDRLEKLFMEIATDKDTIDFLTANGSDPLIGGAREARDLLVRDMQRWKDYAVLAHIEPI